jgi:hypothetical protein
VVSDSVEEVRMPVGRHKGVLFTRIPISYLQWMVQGNHSMAGEAASELARRGTTVPELDVSGHAIDRASTRLWRHWRRDRTDDEGLHHWLHRVAVEAWKSRDPAKPLPETLKRRGIRFVFEVSGNWPTLKTVMPDRKGE